MRKAARSPGLAADSGRGLVEIISRYTQTFLWLQRYDEGLLTEPAGSPGGLLPSLEQARSSLSQLKSQLMAESDPAQKEVLIRLIMNMLAPSL